MKNPLSFRLFCLICLISLGFVSCASAPKPETASSRTQMDTSAFHTTRGDEAISNKQYEKARSAYKQALQLDPNNPAALIGLATASAYEASRPGVSAQTKAQTLEEAETMIEKALDSAESRDKSILAHVHVGAIQIYYRLKLPENEWFEKATDHFEDAIDLNPDNPTPYYFMALGEAENFNYDKATGLLQKVLSYAAEYEIEADQELRRIQRIQRALPGSEFGKKIANVDKITRADIAALFIVELKLDKIYNTQKMAEKDSYDTPKSQRQFEMDPIETYPDAVDIVGHPMETVIQEVIELGIKGLSPDPAHKFHPDLEFKRAEFAQLIQDILVKITKDQSMATSYIGDRSPFPDVNPDVWYYNATRVVVNRGLMQVQNKVTGEFGPFNAVSGADALLAVRTLKEMLRSYQ